MSSLSAAFQSSTTSSQAIAAQRFAQAAQTSPAAQPNTGGYAVQDGFTKNDSNSKISKMLGQTAMTPSDLQAAFQGAAVDNGLDLPAPGSNANFDVSGKHKLPTSPNEPSQSDSKDPGSLFQGADAKVSYSDSDLYDLAMGCFTGALDLGYAGATYGGAYTGTPQGAAAGALGGAMIGCAAGMVIAIETNGLKEAVVGKEDEEEKTEETNETTKAEEKNSCEPEESDTTRPKPDGTSEHGANLSTAELQAIGQAMENKSNGLTQPDGQDSDLVSPLSERPGIDSANLMEMRTAHQVRPSGEEEDNESTLPLGIEATDLGLEEISLLDALTQPPTISGPADNLAGGNHQEAIGDSNAE